MNLKEVFKKNQKNISNNTVSFELFGEDVTQPIRWNNLSIMIVDEIYDGNFEEFTDVLEKIKTVAEDKTKSRKKEALSLGMSGIAKANLAIVWGLIAGAGDVITYEEAQEVTYAITTDEKALVKCWQVMITGDIQKEDLEKIKTNSSNSSKKKIQAQ